MTTEAQAREAGEHARKRGKPMDSHPNYAMGEPGYLLRRAWRAGWLEEDQRRLREVAKG